MAIEFLPDERRYGAFVADPTPEELERFFFLNAAALEVARTKRRRHNRLGWVVQWGTVRMLGTFLEDPVDVPRVVVDYAAGQLGIDNPSCIKQYAERVPTRYEHAWEIRDLLEFRDFTDVQEEVAAFVASRVATTRDSRRELFDRAVLGGRPSKPIRGNGQAGVGPPALLESLFWMIREGTPPSRQIHRFQAFLFRWWPRTIRGLRRLAGCSL